MNGKRCRRVSLGKSFPNNHRMRYPAERNSMVIQPRASLEKPRIDTYRKIIGGVDSGFSTKQDTESYLNIFQCNSIQDENYQKFLQKSRNMDRNDPVLPQKEQQTVSTPKAKRQNFEISPSFGNPFTKDDSDMFNQGISMKMKECKSTKSVDKTNPFEQWSESSSESLSSSSSDERVIPKVIYHFKQSSLNVVTAVGQIQFTQQPNREQPMPRNDGLIMALCAVQVLQVFCMKSFVPIVGLIAIFTLIYLQEANNLTKIQKVRQKTLVKQSSVQTETASKTFKSASTMTNQKLFSQDSRAESSIIGLRRTSWFTHKQVDHKEVMLKSLQTMMILCKLSFIQNRPLMRPSNDKVKVNFHSSSKYTKRKIKMDLIESSDSFFQKLPFYDNFTSIANYAKKLGSFQKNEESKEQNDILLDSAEISHNASIQSLSLNKAILSPQLNGENKKFRRLTLVRDQIFSPSIIERDQKCNSVSLTVKNDQSKALSQFEIDLLELKIYTPYFISRSTVIEYQTKDFPEKLSIMDILEKHFVQKKTQSKIFFKVNLNEDFKMRKQSISLNNFDQDIESLNSAAIKKICCCQKPQQMEEIKETLSENEIEKKASKRYSIQVPKKTSLIIRKSQSEMPKQGTKSDQEVPSKKSLEILSSQDSSSENSDTYSESCGTSQTSQFYDHNHKFKQKNEKIRYYEFEIRQIAEDCGSVCSNSHPLTFLSMRDITSLIVNHQNCCDKVYQEAIENNYSHEQMTPLNPILSHTSLGKQRLIRLYSELLKIPQEDNSGEAIERVDYKILQKIIQQRPESKVALQQSISVEQSAKAIWYYNTNQIKRMKLMKNQLDVSPFPIKDMIATIWNVLWPFEHYIFRRRINIYLIQKFKFENHSMVADWYLYEAILFNIIQNALKYNESVNGDVVITQTCKPGKLGNFVLETCIIDSGIGISPDRQDLLFIPFLELKDRIGIIKAQNDNIGLGLSCSKEICKKMGGDLRLKHSEKGMTVFSFKIPIQLKANEEEKLDEYSRKSFEILSENSYHHLKRFKLIGNDKKLFTQIRSYLKENGYLYGDDKNDFQKLVSFPSQKIGFQLLEDLNHQELQVKQNQDISADINYKQSEQIEEEEKQPREYLRGANRMLQEMQDDDSISVSSKAPNESMNPEQLQNLSSHLKRKIAMSIIAKGNIPSVHQQEEKLEIKFIKDLHVNTFQMNSPDSDFNDFAINQALESVNVPQILPLLDELPVIQTSNHSILIAEDNEFNLMTLTLILKEQLGVSPDNISEAQNGKIAVQMFKEALENGNPYKLVLMDIQMPVMDGLEAAKQITRMKKDVNIVALTSYTGADVKKQCMQVGMKEVFNKPVTSDTMSKVLGIYFNNQ